MTKAFAICFFLGLVLMWISLSMEHGREVGKKLKKACKDFFKGKKGGHQRE